MSLPQALSESLITRWVDGELVIIDEATNAVHCLPNVAARVFMQCNGRETPEEIAVAEGVDLVQVNAALEALGEAGLLLTAPSKLDLTRRAFASRTGKTAMIAAGAAPLITSLLLPAAAHAYSARSCEQVVCSGFASGSTPASAKMAAQALANKDCRNHTSLCGPTAGCVGKSSPQTFTSVSGSIIYTDRIEATCVS